MRQRGLFNNYKYCDFCGIPLSVDYEGIVCPACEENQLFREVKEFIRANDVTEYDVAQEFNIPLHQVKKWIREGRIEYKEKPERKKISTFCIECGALITFGALCSNCLKKQNVAGYSKIVRDEHGRMRYLEENDK